MCWHAFCSQEVIKVACIIYTNGFVPLHQFMRSNKFIWAFRCYERDIREALRQFGPTSVSHSHIFNNTMQSQQPTQPHRPQQRHPRNVPYYDYCYELNIHMSSTGTWKLKRNNFSTALLHVHVYWLFICGCTLESHTKIM